MGKNETQFDYEYGVMTPAEQIREFLHLTDLMQIDTE